MNQARRERWCSLGKNLRNDRRMGAALFCAPDAHAYEEHVFDGRNSLDRENKKSIICLTNFHEHQDYWNHQVKN